MVKRWCANKQQREIIRTDDDDDDDYALRAFITQQTEELNSSFNSTPLYRP